MYIYIYIYICIYIDSKSDHLFFYKSTFSLIRNANVSALAKNRHRKSIDWFLYESNTGI